MTNFCVFYEWRQNRKIKYLYLFIVQLMLIVISTYSRSEYNGTPLMQTSLGPTQCASIGGVSLFQGLFNIHNVHSGMHAVSALQWISLFQGCPQGGVPLYEQITLYIVRFVDLNLDLRVTFTST